MPASPHPHRRTLLATLMAGAAVPGWAALTAPETKVQDKPEISPVWRKVRTSLFGQREVRAADPALLRLEAPTRAVDGAVVPVALRVGPEQRPERFVERLYLVIDSNPSPVSAILQFSPRSGRVDIETRVRVDEYSHVRAISEMNDGSLAMVTRFVKAAGGCSAPPGTDPQAALAGLGRMNLQLLGEPRAGRPVQAQLSINHPNHSGMAMDQVSRLFVPAHFVRQVKVGWRGETVMDADLDFSISENPSLRFWFVPDRDGELTVDVNDTQAMAFSRRFPVRLGGA